MYGMGEYIKSVDNHNKALSAYIARVDEEMNKMDDKFIGLAASHSAVAARQRVQHDNLEQRIEVLEGDASPLGE